MDWNDVRDHLQHGAELIFTDDIPGGSCFALRRSSSDGRSKLMKVQDLPVWANAVWANAQSRSDTRSVLAALEMAIARG